jgi:histidinol dehydrogenase
MKLPLQSILAADMLSQAEHDRLASAVLLAVGHGYGQGVSVELDKADDVTAAQ